MLSVWVIVRLSSDVNWQQTCTRLRSGRLGEAHRCGGAAGLLIMDLLWWYWFINEVRQLDDQAFRQRSIEQ